MPDRGHWITDENSQRRWQGVRRWSEKRGPARISYDYDEPISVVDCQLPDGTRGWPRRILPTKAHPFGEWYRRLPDGTLQAGRIEFFTQDVRFLDDLSRSPRRIGPQPSDGRRAAESEYGTLEWNGPRQWLEIHGAATIEFLTDRAQVVINCLLPNDSRGTVHCEYPLINHMGGWWRRPTTGDRWQTGEIVVSDCDVQFIDNDLPPASDERGGWVDDPRLGRAWDGPNCWAVPHGNAVVVNFSDRGPTSVYACLLSDGTRVTVTKGSEGEWRRPLPDGSWRRGAIRVSEDDVRFFDGPLRTPRALGTRSPDSAPRLDDDLMASARIRELAADRRFAVDLYRALCNMRWFRADKEWGCTWRGAGGIVADLRDLGEEYLDFYGSGREGTVTEEVARELEQLDWRWVPYSAER